MPGRTKRQHSLVILLMSLSLCLTVLSMTWCSKEKANFLTNWNTTKILCVKCLRIIYRLNYRNYRHYIVRTLLFYHICWNKDDYVDLLLQSFCRTFCSNFCRNCSMILFSDFFNLLKSSCFGNLQKLKLNFNMYSIK